jgi:phosphomannomutase
VEQERTRSDPIRFGTSGWRGVLGEEVTVPRLAAAARGAAAWLAEQGSPEVVVAHDTRFLSARLAEVAAAVVAERGLRPVVSRGPVPTPAAVRAVLRRRAAGALVLTASHNPPEYHGLKVFGPWGGGIDDATARRIERDVAAQSTAPPRPAPALRRADLRAPYRRELLRAVDRRAIARAGLRVVVDALHGTGAGNLDAALSAAGAEVETLHPEPDPRFGGAPPDPSPGRLRELRARVRRLRGLSLGLATDGDADRFAAVDEAGRVLSETEALALLVDHLARGGRAVRGVAVSIATGSLVERVAARYGLTVTRHPIGFKHFAPPLVSGAAEIAGEESGGFALGAFSRDKDGILAGCLLAERVAVFGRPLGHCLAQLFREHGKSRCGRAAWPAGPAGRAALERLRRAPPSRVDGARVHAVRRDDGLHLALEDGFLMLRASGTEPVLRVYAEAPGAGALRRRLAVGAALVGACAVSAGSG